MYWFLFFCRVFFSFLGVCASSNIPKVKPFLKDPPMRAFSVVVPFNACVMLNAAVQCIVICLLLAMTFFLFFQSCNRSRLMQRSGNVLAALAVPAFVFAAAVHLSYPKLKRTACCKNFHFVVTSNYIITLRFSAVVYSRNTSL